ncbi:zinc finger, CCHC-type containing protein [Tanacetum coccineum]
MVATTCHTDGRLLRNFKFASSMDTVASCNSKLRYRKPLYAESLVLPKDPIVNVLKCIMKTVKNGLSGLAESSKLRAFLIVSSCFAASEVYGADTEENADHCGLFIHWRIMTQRILSAVTDEVGGIVEAIGSFDLVLPNGLIIVLDNCHYAPSITKGVVSVSCLVDKGFTQCFMDFGLSVSMNNINKRTKSNLDSTYLWHCRLAHINKKRIEKLQHDGLLKSTDNEPFDQCVSCISGKMTRKPFSHKTKKVKDVLGLIHTDVCGTLRHVSNKGASYFVTFTDDYSRYGYVYLLKHKHEVFETFKDYALESPARILNMVLTKKVNKTPYELWHGKVPNLSYLKDTLRKLCYYCSYYPLENKKLLRDDPDRLCFNVEVEEHNLGDLNEPANNKAALSDPEFKKWLVAMNPEMKSMYDNKVWRLVVLPPNAKVVKSKWIYKKKTDMDGKVHIYKARLVAKGCTQTYGVDYEETFSPVADLRSIRILIAIAAFYDYEIWQLDVKTAFLNGFLEEEIYMEQPEGSIMYAVRCTRPDVAFAQNITSRFQQNPGEAHWTAVKNILKYLRNTKDTFLVYGGNPEAELQVKCYCDAGFETDRDDTKSQTGYVFVLNGGAVVWKSSKQSTTAQHATEAEYIAASEAAKEAVWIRKFIDELGVVPSNDYPIKMNCDNSAAIIIAKESGIQKGARHFQRKYHYVRECIKTGEIDIVKVHTDENLADPFTKALAGPKLTRHARSMGLRPASSFM